MITSLIGFVGLLAFGLYWAIRPPDAVSQSALVWTNQAEIRETIGINYALNTREGEPEYVSTIRFNLGSVATASVVGGSNVRSSNPTATDSLTPTNTPPVAGVVYCTPGVVGVDPCLDAWIALGTPDELVDVAARWTVTLPPSTTPFPTATRSWFVTLPPLAVRATPEPERTFLPEAPEADGAQHSGRVRREAS